MEMEAPTTKVGGPRNQTRRGCVSCHITLVPSENKSTAKRKSSTLSSSNSNSDISIQEHHLDQGLKQLGNQILNVWSSTFIIRFSLANKGTSAGECLAFLPRQKFEEEEIEFLGRGCQL